MSLWLILSVFVMSVAADQDPLKAVSGDVQSRHKRQTKEYRCNIPDSLRNGYFFTHHRRCPGGTTSDECALKPSTYVGFGWVIRYACDVGYSLSTPRVASICAHKPGGAKWLPPLPSCLESSYRSPSLPSKSECGKPARHLRTKRRIYGKISKRGAWPWMVVFGYNKISPRNPRGAMHWFCAGTLVTTRHVLTAANCVADHRHRPDFIARVGDLTLNDTGQDGADPIEVGIDKIAVNPWFKPNEVFAHNIAVVKLKNDLRITDYVRPICLPTPDFKDRTFAGETLYFTSWGQTDDNRAFDPILHEFNAKVVDHQVCNRNYMAYQSTDTPIVISDRIICAAVPVNRSCQGDIGSPLMVKVRGSYSLLGIVATKHSCYDEYYPRTFTKLSMYMDWILTHLKL